MRTSAYSLIITSPQGALAEVFQDSPSRYFTIDSFIDIFDKSQDSSFCWGHFMNEEAKVFKNTSGR